MVVSRQTSQPLFHLPNFPCLMQCLHRILSFNGFFSVAQNTTNTQVDCVIRQAWLTHATSDCTPVVNKPPQPRSQGFYSIRRLQKYATLSLWMSIFYLVNVLSEKKYNVENKNVVTFSFGRKFSSIYADLIKLSSTSRQCYLATVIKQSLNHF